MNRPSDLAARLQAGLDGDPDQRAATTLLTHAGRGVWLAKLGGWDTYFVDVADLRRPGALAIDWARLRADLAADDTARTQFADWATSHRGLAATDTEHDARWQATVPTRPWHGASTSELVLLRIALDPRPRRPARRRPGPARPRQQGRRPHRHRHRGRRPAPAPQLAQRPARAEHVPGERAPPVTTLATPTRPRAAQSRTSGRPPGTRRSHPTPQLRVPLANTGTIWYHYLMGAHKTPEQRQEWIAEMEARTRAAQEQLVESVTGLARGDGWRAWLDFAARLPHYSVSNQLLLAAQAEHASLVMSASEWRQVGRYPARGTTALRIWAPRRAPRADTGAPRAAEPGEVRDHPSTAGTDLSMAGADPANAQRPEQRPEPGSAPRGGTRFLLVPVFDVSQTAGEPLPAQPTPVPPPPGQAPHGMWHALSDYATAAGFTVGFGDCGPADGVTDFASRSIRIAATGSPLSHALTLVHEIGHATLHADPAHRQHGAAHRGRAEVEAESVAYLVAADHGLTDALDWHFDYLAHWAAALTGPAADPDTTRAAIRDTAARVLAAARPLLTHLREANVGHPYTPTPTRAPDPAPLVVATAAP